MGQEISRAHSRGYNDGLGGGTYIGQSLVTKRLLHIIKLFIRSPTHNELR
jgi:hypothetical protein